MSREFAYGPKATFILKVFGLAAVGGAGAAYYGATHHGVPAGIAWGATAFCGALACLCLWLVYVSRLGQRLVIADEAITLPRSPFTADSVTVAYGDIRELKVTDTGQQRSIEILHPHGRFCVVGFMLPEKTDFDELVGLLQDRRSRNVPSQMQA